MATTETHMRYPACASHADDAGALQGNTCILVQVCGFWAAVAVRVPRKGNSACWHVLARSTGDLARYSLPAPRAMP